MYRTPTMKLREKVSDYIFDSWNFYLEPILNDV